MQITPVNNFYHRKLYNSSFGSNKLNFSPSFGAKFDTRTVLDLADLSVNKPKHSLYDNDNSSLFHYKNYLYKIPKAAQNSKDNAIKEFYIINRLRQKEEFKDMTQLPIDLAQFATGHMLIEKPVDEMVVASPAKEFDLPLVKKILDQLSLMDQTGITNHGIRPHTTTYLKDNGGIRMLDFDSFSFIKDDGQVAESKELSNIYYAKKIPERYIKDTAYRGSGTKGREFEMPHTNEELFAKTFFFDKKYPSGAKSLVDFKDVSENPFLNTSSNVINFEYNVLYSKILSGQIKNPREFLRDYVEYKSKTYHKDMGDFLKTLEIEAPKNPTPKQAEAYEKAKEKLQNAIEYEELAAGLFNEYRPDSYFAKLEMAKMQLRAFTYTKESLTGNGEPAGQFAHYAYEELIKILYDGINAYSDRPNYQKYLTMQLEHFLKGYSLTDFSTTEPKKRTDPNIDIIWRIFEDDGKDLNALHRLRKTANIRVNRRLEALEADFRRYNIPVEKRGAVIKKMVTETVFETIQMADKRASEKDKNQAIEEVTKEILDSLEDSKN